MKLGRLAICACAVATLAAPAATAWSQSPIAGIYCYESKPEKLKKGEGFRAEESWLQHVVELELKPTKSGAFEVRGTHQILVSVDHQAWRLHQTVDISGMLQRDGQLKANSRGGSVRIPMPFDGTWVPSAFGIQLIERSRSELRALPADAIAKLVCFAGQWRTANGQGMLDLRQRGTQVEGTGQGILRGTWKGTVDGRRLAFERTSGSAVFKGHLTLLGQGRNMEGSQRFNGQSSSIQAYKTEERMPEAGSSAEGAGTEVKPSSTKPTEGKKPPQGNGPKTVPAGKHVGNLELRTIEIERAESPVHELELKIGAPNKNGEQGVEGTLVPDISGMRFDVIGNVKNGRLRARGENIAIDGRNIDPDDYVVTLDGQYDAKAGGFEITIVVQNVTKNLKVTAKCFVAKSS